MNRYEPTIEVRVITTGTPNWHAVIKPMSAKIEARNQKPHSSSHPDEVAMIVYRKEPKNHPAMRPSMEIMAQTLVLTKIATSDAMTKSVQKHAMAPPVVPVHPSPMQTVNPVLNRKMAVKVAVTCGNQAVPKRPTMGPAIR